MDRKLTSEDLYAEQRRQAKLAAMNGDDEDDAIERQKKRARRKSKKSAKEKDKDYKSESLKIAESLVANGERANEELAGGDYRKRLNKYRDAQNQGQTVDFAQMSKDKRCAVRLPPPPPACRGRCLVSRGWEHGTPPGAAGTTRVCRRPSTRRRPPRRTPRRRRRRWMH
jgi:hypothetical protein